MKCTKSTKRGKPKNLWTESTAKMKIKSTASINKKFINAELMRLCSHQVEISKLTFYLASKERKKKW